MNDRDLAEFFDTTVEKLDLVQSVLRERLQAIRDSMQGWPASARYESDRGSGHGRSVTWCDDHQQELQRCLGEDWDCAGTVLHLPADPVGEAALRFDKAAADRKALERSMRGVARDADRIIATLGGYKPRAATDKERRETLADNDRAELCWSHARVEVARGVKSGEPARQHATVDGEDVPLCRWCADFLRSTGVLPTTEQVAAYIRGDRVRRSA